MSRNPDCLRDRLIGVREDLCEHLALASLHRPNDLDPQALFGAEVVDEHAVYARFACPRR